METNINYFVNVKEKLGSSPWKLFQTEIVPNSLFTFD